MYETIIRCPVCKARLDTSTHESPDVQPKDTWIEQLKEAHRGKSPGCAHHENWIDQCIDGPHRVGEQRHPRRIDILQQSVAEGEIRKAMLAVERMAADVRLTDAVILLEQALRKVDEYIEKP